VKAEVYCTQFTLTSSFGCLLEALPYGKLQSEIYKKLKTSKAKYYEPYPIVSSIIRADELNKHDITITSALDAIRTKSSLKFVLKTL